MHSDFRMIPKNYQHHFSMHFATFEIENIKLLPNMTLIPEILDDGFLARLTIQNIVNLLFWIQGSALNYKCSRRRKRRLWDVIGGLTSHSSVHIAHILNIYKIPQVGEFFTGQFVK